MKKILVLIFSVICISLIATSGMAKKKAGKMDPCVKKCVAEKNACFKKAKKSKKSDRKAEYAACQKAFKECKANCSKPEEKAEME